MRRLDDEPLTTVQVERELPLSVPDKRVKAARQLQGHYEGGAGYQVVESGAEFPRRRRAERACGEQVVMAQLLQAFRSKKYIHPAVIRQVLLTTTVNEIMWNC